MDIITNFITNIQISDYILGGISLFFSVIFIIIGIEKVYRIYLGLIIGLFTFFILNLVINNLNQSSGLSSISNFILNHKIGILESSLLLIPIFTILLPFNNIISFRINKNLLLNYIISFLFGLFFVGFYLSIFISIVNNNFLFTLNSELLQILQNSEIINSFFDYFNNSYIYNFIFKYNSLINLIIIIFIFYKMTIGGIIDYIFGKIIDLIITLRNKEVNKSQKNIEELAEEYNLKI